MRRILDCGLAGALLVVLAACGIDLSSAEAATRAPVAAPDTSGPSAGESPSTTQAAAATPDLFATGCGDGLIDLSGPLTGSWRANDGGVYYLRQAGGCLWWFGTHLTELKPAGGQPGWANVAVGHIVGDDIYLEWSDVPLGTTQGRGTLTLRVAEGGDRIVKIDQPVNGDFGGSFWDRITPHSSESEP